MAAAAPKVKTSNHAPYIDLVRNAIIEIKDRKGASRQAIGAVLLRNTTLGGSSKMINKNIKSALLKGVSDGVLIQTSGTGASGRFKVNNGAKAPVKVSTPRTAKAAEPAKIKKIATAVPKKASEKSPKTAKQVNAVPKTTAAKTSTAAKSAKNAPAVKKSSTTAKATETPKSAPKPKKAAAKPAPKKANK
ncbi:unnamed protein product [Caenorhabditis angaria]|uniref:H15 domain-containing protein n=1 Tax=Caenorhabditis angaria TaxID=860376 RepID=A0A9P1I4Z0_9PELO|nr:unnamed protein product [Caenorhabditis angaria]